MASSDKLKKYYSATFVSPHETNHRITIEAGSVQAFVKQHGAVGFWVYQDKDSGLFKLASSISDPEGIEKFYISSALITQGWRK